MKYCEKPGCRSRAKSICWECGNSFCHEHLIASDKHRTGLLCGEADCREGHKEPVAWRCNIAPNGKPAYRVALTESVVGCGWVIPGLKETTDRANFNARASATGRLTSSCSAAMNVIENRMAVGDFVWMRATGIGSGKDGYYLGQITSSWRYDPRSPFKQDELVNIRNCHWCRVDVKDVPRAALHLRGTFREMPNIGEYSKRLYNKLSRKAHSRLEIATSGSLMDYLSWQDCEDLVALFLRAKHGLSPLPSTCKHSMPDIEYLLWKPDGTIAAAQVKSGKQAFDYCNLGDFDCTVYVLALSERYVGNKPKNVVLLKRAMIEKWAKGISGSLPSQLQSGIGVTDEHKE